MKSARAAAVLAVSVLLVVVVASRPGSATSSPVRPVPARSHASWSGVHKIKHVVVIVQENRSFHEYFGTYRGADGIPGLAGHPGKVPCVPDPGERCVRPFHDRQDFNEGRNGLDNAYT